jgi:UDP-N-acetylglucosamine acyltransferase
MSMQSSSIHPSAIVSADAKLGEGVSVGPYTVIDGDVEIGAGTEIRNSVYIADGARIGSECRIFSGAVIATEPQDLKFAGEPTLAIIGDRTVIRECATVNRGTSASGQSVVGQDCLIMAYCHVAHDCVLGNNIVMANATHLAGHVTINDWAVLGGGTLVHQFCNVGRHTMIGAGTYVTKDVCNYLLAEGNDLKIHGINRVGLRRRGFTAETMREIEEFYKILFRSGLNVSAGLATYQQRENIRPEIQECIDFIKASSRGIYIGKTSS